MDGAEKELLVIMPKDAQQTENARLDAVLAQAIAGYDTEFWYEEREFVPLKNRRILFVLNLGADGINLEYQRLLRWLRRSTPTGRRPRSLTICPMISGLR